MSNEEKDDRTVMMTDLPHFLKQMEEEDAAKKAAAGEEAEVRADANVDDSQDSGDDHTMMMSVDMLAEIDAAGSAADPADTKPGPEVPATEEASEDDHTVMMTADVAAQIDASPSDSVAAPEPESQKESVVSEPDDDHTVMMAVDAVAQIDAQAEESRPDEASSEENNHAEQPVSDATVDAAPAPTSPKPAAVKAVGKTTKVSRPTPKKKGGTGLIITGAVGAFICFVVLGLYAIIHEMQGGPTRGTMNEMFMVIGPLGFITFTLAGLGFMAAKGRTGLMSLMTGIFACVLALAFLLLMISVLTKEKDFFGAMGHILPIAVFLTMTFVGIWAFTGLRRASGGLGVTLGIIALLAGVVALVFWIMTLTNNRLEDGMWMALIRPMRSKGEVFGILHLANSALAAISFVIAGIGLLKVRKL